MATAGVVFLAAGGRSVFRPVVSKVVSKLFWIYFLSRLDLYNFLILLW
jgi:hypothetical protein